MSEVSPQVEAFWQAYLAALPNDAARPGEYEAWSFGDSPEMADTLGRLVTAGTKTATCCSLRGLELDGELLPETGNVSIILDGRGEPLCVIETVEVEVKPYNEVGADFARAEGEGDGSLAYWREAHKRFFTREGRVVGYTFTETMPLVCERFRVVYPLPITPRDSRPRSP